MYRSEALQIQLPPDNSIEALRTKVKAKKKAAHIPMIIGCKASPPIFVAVFQVSKNQIIVSYLK